MKAKKYLILSALAVTPFLFTACNCFKSDCSNKETACSETKKTNLVKSSHPFINQSYKNIRWSELTPDTLVEDIRMGLKETQAKYDAIANQPLDDKLTYENTIDAMYKAGEQLEFSWNLASHLESVCSTPEFRNAYNKILPEVTEFYTKISLNDKLWKIVKTYAASENAKTLSPEKARYLDKIVKGFKKGGADLSPEKKKEWTELMTHLTNITQKFAQNVLDATNATQIVVTDEKRLKGIPENAIKKAAEVAKEKGMTDKPTWIFTLQRTSSFPVMSYAEDESLRKELWEKTNTLCMNGQYDNTKLVQEIVAIRQRQANILGYKNFSDYLLEDRMAKNGETALKFIVNLYDKVKPFFDAEYQDLLKFSKKDSLTPWETAYWTEKLRKDKYDFDGELVRPYLPMNNVIPGMFDLCEKLFDIKIVKEKTIYIKPGSTEKNTQANVFEVWHPEVKYYSIFDAKTNKKLGSFYMDWYPRESKRSGAWMNSFFAGNRENGNFEPHLALICGNLTPPSADKPALLSHEDVETIYHEFGHLLHHILGNTPVAALNGTNVAWDFVEVPSQLMENFTWESSILKTFAKHYKTGEVLPDDILKNMMRAKNFNVAYRQMRQLGFAYEDLMIHINAKSIAGKNVNDYAKELLKNWIWPTNPYPNTSINQFNHLFRAPVAYSSGYYSYKWAEALEADFFTKFKKADGSVDYSVGKKYRKEVLEKGDSIDANKIILNFLGRESNPDALLIRDGLYRK